jgi:DNA-binding MarR family transcriptional regulator
VAKSRAAARRGAVSGPESGTERAPRRAPRSAPALPPLDRLLHERVRLGIVSALAANPTLSFGELKTLMGATDGNLSVHARKLEDAGYVSCSKSFQGRVPKTEYRLTPEGRRAFEKYLDHLEAVIRNSRG